MVSRIKYFDPYVISMTTIADFDDPTICYVISGKNPIYVPGVLCTNHGPFSWGADAAEAVHNAVVMEEVAKMAYRCEHLKKDIEEAPQVLQDKHFFRKHGENAYYGNDL